MLNKLKTPAIVAASLLVFASSTQAKEVSLETYVNGLVEQAMNVAQQEMQNNLRSAILTVANNVSFDEEKDYVAKVSITDLKTDIVEANNPKAE